MNRITLPFATVCAAFGLLVSLQAAPLLNEPVGDAFAPDFTKPLGSEWEVKKGEWHTQDGVLHASEIPEQKHASVVWHPGKVETIIITTEFQLGNAHVLYFGVDGKGHIGRLVIQKGIVGIYDDSPDANGKSTSKPLATAKVKLDPKTWYSVTYEIRGDEMVAQVAGITLKAKNAFFANPKVHYWIAGGGQDLQLRNFKAWDGKPNPNWPGNAKDAIDTKAP